MSRRPELEPRWLIGLLNQWALRISRDQAKGLGYYTINPMLRDGIPGRVRSYEPTGYSDVDFLDVQNAVEQLDVMRRLAVMRYFKPWSRNAIDAEVSRDPDTWMYHLRIALERLQVDLQRKALARDDISGYSAEIM
jgi:hypothetical protein